MSHLQDIYNISKEVVEPNHTTQNSMRQILESIKHFLHPYSNDKSFEQFLGGIEELKDSCLYSRSQDGSHGDVFLGQNFNKAELIDLSKRIIQFIEKDFLKG